MFCPACGKQIDEGDTFCRHCGKSTSANSAVASVPAQVQVKNVYAGKKEQVIGVVVLVLGLFVMIGSCANAKEGDSTWAWTFTIPLAGCGIALWGGIKHWWHN